MARGGTRWLDLVWQMWNSPSARAKLLSLVFLVVAMVWGWRRLQTAQERDRRRREAELAAANNRAGGAGGARPGGGGAGAFGGGGMGGDDNKQANTRRGGAAPNTNTPAGRVAKYLERNGGSGNGRMTVVVSARVLLSGLTAANSDGLAAPIEFVDAAAGAGAPGGGGNAVVALVRRLASASTVFVITKVPTNPSALEERVLAAFDAAGLLGATLIKPHNVLFCSSAAGKGAMIRHITPNLVIDDEMDVLEKLRPHLDDVVHAPAVDASFARNTTGGSGTGATSNSGGSRGAGIIGQCDSIADYFGATAAAAAAAPAAAALPSTSASAATDSARDVKRATA